MYALSIACIIIFLLGNLAFAPILNFLPWYIKNIISEFMFVIMYTFIDYGNFKYRYKFTLITIGGLVLLALPIFSNIFYNQTAQFFSISVSVITVYINAKVFLSLHFNKNMKKILCSKISTISASFVEIVLFSTILHLGLKGVILMSFLRLVYVKYIPELIFKKTKH